jgi:uncharacterized NAD-dependent epimerase/dehydratase family protein
MNFLALKSPYLIVVGDETDPIFVKTGIGLAKWRPDDCAGQLRFNSSAVDLGLPDLDVRAAASLGVRSVIIGAAPIGGALSEPWLGTLVEAASLGMDVVSGLHQRLASHQRLRVAAEVSGAALVDVRVPPDELPVASGRRRTGMRLLTVGTDCAVGKKYTALQLETDMRSAGFAADFRASGQTGIMIAGRGVPLDAVVSDFLSGAAELLSPDNEPGHWDIIEGQGGIFHPAYAPVSFGLLVGSQPDAFVVCHAAGRSALSGWPQHDVPDLQSVIDRTVELGRPHNPGIRCVGISINSASLTRREAAAWMERLGDEYGLPCVDPLMDGTRPIVERISAEFGYARACSRPCDGRRDVV